jgi:hypothetical protein
VHGRKGGNNCMEYSSLNSKWGQSSKVDHQFLTICDLKVRWKVFKNKWFFSFIFSHCSTVNFQHGIEIQLFTRGYIRAAIYSCSIEKLQSFGSFFFSNVLITTHSFDAKAIENDNNFHTWKTKEELFFCIRFFFERSFQKIVFMRDWV